MHPPSGALVMVAAIGGPGISELGYGLLLPVACNSLLPIAAALVYNNRGCPNVLLASSGSDLVVPARPVVVVLGHFA
ncbi:HPP family protein [Pseudomonas xanthomarina]|nr:HPP family protein [Stutzerimonas xanthomarina]MCP9338526.1 HPP family protein [Stutzerimonas xanthomarina]